jgi:hypothetical protein
MFSIIQLKIWNFNGFHISLFLNTNQKLTFMLNNSMLPLVGVVNIIEI